MNKCHCALRSSPQSLILKIYSLWVSLIHCVTCKTGRLLVLMYLMLARRGWSTWHSHAPRLSNRPHNHWAALSTLPPPPPCSALIRLCRWQLGEYLRSASSLGLTTDVSGVRSVKEVMVDADIA